MKLLDTGDIKLTLKNVADPGWLMFADQTFGSEDSNADIADDTTEALFEVFFDGLTDAHAPILTNAGAQALRGDYVNAAEAWTSHCRIQLLRSAGKLLAVASDSHPHGSSFGSEMHLLTTAEMPSHQHAMFVYDPSHSHNLSDGGHNHTLNDPQHQHVQAGHGGVYAPLNPAVSVAPNQIGGWSGTTHTGAWIVAAGTGITLGNRVTGVRVSNGTIDNWTTDAGQSLPHNNMGPSVFVNAMVKK